ncbi:hypothetical protein D9C73_002779 [Collichthys lucidus]|uniref:Uncharacterized protein n=1 Tax=Collichthys lucidus TaxID=240159 RepID=A0A4U5U3I8_COLLU|nr:hypothetical protein D9C73_002779 [Collichthys lucidus]
MDQSTMLTESIYTATAGMSINVNVKAEARKQRTSTVSERQRDHADFADFHVSGGAGGFLSALDSRCEYGRRKLYTTFTAGEGARQVASFSDLSSLIQRESSALGSSVQVVQRHCDASQRKQHDIQPDFKIKDPN